MAEKVTDKCRDCDRADWPDYGVDDCLWREIGNGRLCLNCFAARFQNAYGEPGAEGIPYPLVIYVAGTTLPHTRKEKPHA